MKRASDEDSATAAVSKDDASLEEALVALPQLLRKRRKTLEERERELEKAVAAFEREKSSIVGDHKPSDVLHLNVGGTPLAVLRRTLTSVEGSMLASRFSGLWDQSIETDRDGNFFIDQPIELFKPMVDYLREKACETLLAPPATSPAFDDEVQRRNFVRMVEYFGMTPGVFPTVIELHRGEPGTAVITGHPDLGVSASEWATFTLQVQGHNRPVKSFSVVLGQVERAQIGWVRIGHFVKRLRRGDHKGVGEEEFTVGLDCCRGGLLYQGSFTKLDNISIGQGTVVRCENKGERWLVDGQVVASSIALDETMCISPDLQKYSLIPAISGKGNWRVSTVELSC